MKAPRFYFITNDAERAAREFSCHPGNLPAWMAVLDSFDAWLKIPAGAKCMGLWYGTRAEMDGWRNAWSTRRDRGDLVGIAPEELDKIHAWARDNRARDTLRLLYGVAPEPDGIASEPDRAEAVAAAAQPVAAAAVLARHTKAPANRGSKWT